MVLDLTPALPELILFIGALVLLLVGRLPRAATPPGSCRRSPCCCWSWRPLVTVAHDKTRTVAFGGHFVLDGYAAFLKVLILLGAGGGAAAGRRLPARRADRALRVRAAGAVLDARHVHDGLGQQLPRALHGAGAAEPADLRAGRLPPRQSALDRGRAEIFRPGRFGLGHAALRLLPGLRLHRHGPVRRAGRALVEAASRGRRLPLGALVGLVFIVAGLAFKMAAVPFHMWTPDVYEGAPSPVTAFMAAAPKVAAVGPRRMRVLFGPFGHWVDQWQQIVIVVSIASMALGAFAAIGQTNIKRLMAYSGIANVGYALVGVAAGTDRRRQRRAGLHRDLPGDDAGHLRLHPADAPPGPLRRDASPISPACRAGGR